MREATGLVSVLLAATGVTSGIINPNFTPRHLVQQSDVVLAGRLAKAGDVEWKLTVRSRIKASSPPEHVLSLAACKKDAVPEVRKALDQNGAAEVILYAGTFNEQTRAYLHVMGVWLNVKGGGKGRWLVTGFAPHMTATYAGGTDKLILMSRYLANDPDADVPVTAGVRWMENIKVGKVAGKLGGMAAVEFGKTAKGGARPLCLFVASDAGDRLYRPKPDDEALEDVTAAARLDTKSRRFLWLDLNADGQADLISWDGSRLTCRLADGKGGLTRAGAAPDLTGLDDCLALAACSVDGSPAVLLSTQIRPVLLTLQSGKGWKKTPLPAGDAGGLGQVSACVVADLDGDGFVDVLQPGDDAGRLWKGKPGGFAKPVKSSVCTGGGPAIAAVADFDETGSPDIFLSGPKAHKLWENDGRGGFAEVFRFTGSMSYKCPTGASDAQAMDLNHDGRADICLIYPAGGILYHWSRGFRAFGEEGEVKLTGTEAAPGEPPVGQRAMAVGDFNGDGSLDLAVVLTTGMLHCFYNDLMDKPALRLRLPKGVTGPVTASCWLGGKHPICTAVATVAGHAPPAYVTARYPGTVTIRFRPPGGSATVQKAKAEAGATDVVLKIGAGK